MDTFTHALSGALAARALESRENRLRIAAGALGGAFPDCDFGLRLIDTLTYLNWHQGPTHSLVLAPIWALPLAQILSWATKASLSALYLPVTLGIVVHALQDALTAYGPMLFAPFSFERYAYPLVFVIDPYFGAIALAGLVGTLVWRARWPAVAALTVMGGYVVLAALLHQRAVEFGAAYARLNHLEGARSYALPQPFSPFNWKVIVAHGDRYDHALVRLNSGSSGDGTSLIARMRASYRRPDAPEWTRHSRYGETAQQRALARAAWDEAAFEPFRRFAQFPALDHIADGCVWFVDLRFTLPEIKPAFRYGMCRAGEGWVRGRLHGDFLID